MSHYRGEVTLVYSHLIIIIDHYRVEVILVYSHLINIIDAYVLREEEKQQM